ncbi:hypothetical protein Afil01_05670 [Actinorhabdospora filicis]|uniref:DUF998 domain-containing protein n=1 Tax=Actinorhabdospora filicis TaxID=1785913 RepID=A0A9W6SEJ7_9ACTN|nr:DUF998 domain-containing protein [Actinorhabdospora filicis]GLZ75760.1 hypothetical protein Afil01_05670 [Actinorhabdospora filicis]
MSAGLWTPARVEVATPAAVPVRASAGRRASLFAIAASILAVLCLGYLHMVPSDVDPMRDPVSSYVRVGGGWQFTLGVTAMAAACYVLASAALPGPRTAMLRGVLAIAGASFQTAAVFPTDAGASVVTASAEIHRWAAGIGMGAIPVAGLLFLTVLRGSGRPQAAKWLGVTVAVSVFLLAVTVIGTFLPDFMHSGDWRGLPQRVLLFAELTVVLALAFAAGTRLTRR